jgi:hypothetical protein
MRKGMSGNKVGTKTKMGADRRESSNNQALSRLGRYLSAKGTGGTADTMASRSAARTKGLQNAVATARGGGQGKASPMVTKRTGSVTSKKTVTKSVAPKTTAKKKPAFASGKRMK